MSPNIEIASKDTLSSHVKRENAIELRRSIESQAEPKFGFVGSKRFGGVGSLLYEVEHSATRDVSNWRESGSDDVTSFKKKLLSEEEKESNTARVLKLYHDGVKAYNTRKEAKPFLDEECTFSPVFEARDYVGGGVNEAISDNEYEEEYIPPPPPMVKKVEGKDLAAKNIPPVPPPMRTTPIKAEGQPSSSSFTSNSNTPVKVDPEIIASICAMNNDQVAEVVRIFTRKDSDITRISEFIKKSEKEKGGSEIDSSSTTSSSIADINAAAAAAEEERSSFKDAKADPPSVHFKNEKETFLSVRTSPTSTTASGATTPLFRTAENSPCPSPKHSPKLVPQSAAGMSKNEEEELAELEALEALEKKEAIGSGKGKDNHVNGDDLEMF